MPFLLAEILNFQGSTHHIGVGSFSKVFVNGQEMKTFSNDDELLSISIPQDTLTGHVTVRYAERKIYLLGDIVSVLALISCMIMLIKNNSWKKEERS